MTEKSWRHTFVWILIASGILLLAYLAVVQGIALFYALKHPHTYLDIAKAREESFKLLPASRIVIYLFTWLRVLILPYLSLISFLFWWKTRRRFWWWAFSLSILMALFYASLSLAKMPVAWVVILLVVAYYLARQGRISIKQLVVLGLLVLAFPVFVIFIVMPWAETGLSYISILTGLARRIFWVPAWVLYHYFEVFPQQVGFLHGQSIGFLSTLTGEPFFPVANYVYQYMNPDMPLAHGLANAPFVGNLYADFGLAGVICGSFFIGGISEFSHQYLMRHSKTPIYVATYAYLIGAFFLFNLTALPVVLNTNGLIWVFVLLIGMKLIKGFLKTIGRKKICQNGV